MMQNSIASEVDVGLQIRRKRRESQTRQSVFLLFGETRGVVAPSCQSVTHSLTSAFTQTSLALGDLICPVSRKELRLI